MATYAPMRARWSSVLWLTLWLSGCSEPRLADLPPTVFAVEQEAPFCGSTIAIDGTGTGWREQGCEGSSKTLNMRARLVSSDVQRISDGFAGLPVGGGDSCQPDQQVTYTFSRRTSTTLQRWRVCLQGSNLDSPFGELWGLLNGLVPR